jgi:hypothetical protein
VRLDKPSTPIIGCTSRSAQIERTARILANISDRNINRRLTFRLQTASADHPLVQAEPL